MNRKQRRAEAAKQRQELKRREEVRQELLSDNVSRIALEMGCTLLHLDENDDQTIFLRIFKD